MKTLNEARVGWQDLNIANLKGLRPQDERAPQLQGLRSVAWKECLLFELSDKSNWPQRLSESRSAYNALREHFLRAIHHPDELESAVDPLTENTESPWETLRRDEGIRAEIFQDVERCMPENVYFRQPTTQNMLLDILFIFSKLNPDVGYRQGMHELLAPIVWVVERDALDSRHWRRANMEDTQDDLLLFDLLDQRYIEHDAFTLFCLIMQNAKAFYEPGDGKPKTPSIMQAMAIGEAPILAKIDRIYNRLLPCYDPELSAHLVKLDVVPQVFLMRWMRLLFGREFSFDETLCVWDQLLSSDPTLELVDFICVAMLLRIRWQREMTPDSWAFAKADFNIVLEADANDVLVLLLHYPTAFEGTSPGDLVLDALALKESRNESTSARIISKRTGRTIELQDRASTRPSTPPGGFPPTMGSPNRARSPVRSPSRFPTPNNAVTGLEGLLTDAARAAYSRGERWGLNRAVRGAVGDVRKNLAALNASPRNSLHRRASSTDIIRKVAQLEARNKALSKMLELAVSELWECQRHQAEHQGQSSVEADRAAADALGVAIAKVQFVQVYLSDQSLPLPTEEDPAERMDVSTDKVIKSIAAEGGQLDSSESIEAALAEASGIRTPATVQEPAMEVAQTQATADATREAATQPSESNQRHSPSPEEQESRSRPIQTKPPPTVTTSLAPDLSSSPQSRPSLEQSSFSWMLGHQSADRQHAFASASPFTDEVSLPSRNRGTGKGFLFGEDEDENPSQGSESTRRFSNDGKGPKRRGLLRKKPPASVKSAQASTGSANDGEHHDGRAGNSNAEDINLQDVKPK